MISVNVTKDKVEILNQDLIHKGEYKVNRLYFTFSEEYENLTCKAIFSTIANNYEMAITNGYCEIPVEILTTEQQIVLGVYGYELENDEFVIRYSPTPTILPVINGSYIPGASGSQEITPTQFEQYTEALNDGLERLDEAIESIDIDTQYARDMGDYAKEQGDYCKEEGDKAKDLVDTYTDTLNAMQTDINTNTSNISTNTTNISNLTNRVSQNETDIGNINSNLQNYSLITETGSQLVLNLDATNYKIKAFLKDKNGNTIYTSNEIDLPVESVVVNGEYDSTTKEVVLTLENGNTIRFSVADLVSGLQTEITSSNKLASDLVDDSTSSNKFVTSAEKTTWNNKSDFSGNYNDLSNKPTIPTSLNQLTDDSTHRLVSDTEKATWNAKYDKPNGGIPKTDLASDVQTSLGKADTAIQDISGKLDTSKVKNENSTTAGDVYDVRYVNSLIGDISSAIDLINGESV